MKGRILVAVGDAFARRNRLKVGNAGLHMHHRLQARAIRLHGGISKEANTQSHHVPMQVGMAHHARRIRQVTNWTVSQFHD